ncbi:hypothetical protein DRE_03424 [Drechslerella stenobrocha 248]|uniref:S-adenosyl-L-methionine-dependent methyltransferase n=1 Tax=Drechslerella stenobrocha 248 TaxID=1043628 RepID=W7IE56_9PEZI|nr:hypothetical protein DRE_03424 [Drechslerella stenobrocha 248]
MAKEPAKDMGSATTSLTESVRDYEYENGRRYNGFKRGEWVVPNDDIQQEQLDLMHHVFTLRLGGKLYLAPLNKPQKIMDVGTGTGIWAIQMAEEFPEAAVMGNDLSPIQPNWVPPNVCFEVDDFNEPWLQTPGSYDFIHSRDCHGAVVDWPVFISNAYKVLKPGGWYESHEHTVEITTDPEEGPEHQVPEDNILKEWVVNLVTAAESIGKMLHAHPHIPTWMEDAGFVNIKREYTRLPIGTWPKDPVEKEIGAFNLINMLDATEGYTVALYTRVLNKTAEETAQAIKDIKKNLKNKKFHMYFRFAVTYGQKPE